MNPKNQIIIAALAALIPSLAISKEMQCDRGPVDVVAGGSHWTAYACDDGKTVIAVATPPNPAAPFYFMLRPDGHQVIVFGEGTGDKTTTQKANVYFRTLTPTQVLAIHKKATEKSP